MSNCNTDEILERLTKILNFLNENKELSIKELMNMMGGGVVQKTIERDLTERLFSFPVEREKMKWKLKDSFGFKDYQSLEDAVVLDLLEKKMESGGPYFSEKAKKFVNASNKHYIPFDLKSITCKQKRIKKLENCAKDFKFFLKNEIIGTSDNLIESTTEIKSYLNKYLSAHLKRVGSTSLYLCLADGDQYVVMNEDENYIHRYNSVEKLIDDGWAVSKEIFVKRFSSHY